MKSTVRLSVALLALLGAVPFLHAVDDADLADRRTQAEALLHAMHTEQVLVNATTHVHQMVDKYNPGGAAAQADQSPEQKATFKKAQDEANALIDKQLGWDAVKTDFIQAYADAFTADQLKGLVAFYASPLGQVLVEKQPAVTEKMGRLTQQKMMAVMPSILQKIRDAAPKPSPASPAASPAAPAIAIPAAPAAPATTPGK